MTTVLVTGAAGYIGSVLCPALLQAGYSVIALDSFRYNQSLALAACCADPNFELIVGDVRDRRIYKPLLAKADVLIPLAAIVGMPACARSPDEAVQVNQHAVQWLSAAASKDQLIAFPNTNSAYGRMPEGRNEPLDEDSPRTPLSLYAETKCAAERAVLDHENSVCFRLATVFGASPRMRTDLLLTDFVLRAHRDGFVMLYDPDARRNFVSVHDVSDAFLWAIDRYVKDTGIIAPDGSSHGPIFNLGHDGANVTKAQLVEVIARHVPFRAVVGGGHDPDQRDYVISNARLRAAGFEARHTLDDGVQELLKLYAGFPQVQWGNV
jgi:nucleoside-diphosphate-sugar epimerase